MQIAVMTILLCAGSCMAFADQPAAAPAAPAAAAPATPAADEAQAEIDAKKAAAAEKIKRSGLGGYRPEIHGDKTLYCKVELKTGSRFSEKQCRSYEQLLADHERAKDYTEQMQKMGVQPRQ